MKLGPTIFGSNSAAAASALAQVRESRFTEAKATQFNASIASVDGRSRAGSIGDRTNISGRAADLTKTFLLDLALKQHYA